MMEKSSVKVAVITRTKNRPLMLPRAAVSVAAQKIDNLIWVVVNDGGEKAYVDQAVHKFNQAGHGEAIAVHNTTSMGMEAASNVGISSSSSEYLVIHDDDDSWHSDFLSTCLKYLDNNKEYEGVITHCNTIHEGIENQEIRQLQIKPFNSPLKSVDLAHIAMRNQYPPISFLFSRYAYNKIGGFNESMEVLGDWDFNLRFLLEFDIGLISKYLAYQHVRSTTATISDYSNTVQAGIEKHHQVENCYRHARYRDELLSKQVGLGHLLMTGKQFQLIHDELDKLGVVGAGWRKIQKIAGKLGFS